MTVKFCFSETLKSKVSTFPVPVGRRSHHRQKRHRYGTNFHRALRGELDRSTSAPDRDAFPTEVNEQFMSQHAARTHTQAPGTNGGAAVNSLSTAIFITAACHFKHECAGSVMASVVHWVHAT